MSAVVAASVVEDLDVAVHAGRRGRVVVVRPASARDAVATARRTVEHAAGLRARWLVVDLSAVRAAHDVRSVLHLLRRHAAPAGVGLAVAGGDVGEDEEAGRGPGFLVFPTVPIALGTLGAI